MTTSRSEWFQPHDARRTAIRGGPVWRVLPQASIDALVSGGCDGNGVVRPASDLTDAEIERSPIARNAVILLQRASAGDGVKLTRKGNLARAEVAAMEAAMTWPEHDAETTRMIWKVVNEENVRPLRLLHRLARFAQLGEARRGQLRATEFGRQMLEEKRSGLQALLFRLVFWQIEPQWFTPNSEGKWPQEQIGAVLWALSVTAEKWVSAEALVDLVRQANWQKVGGASPPERRSNQTTFLREPCVGSREGAGEASAAVRMGGAIEHRKKRWSGVPRLSDRSKATSQASFW